MAIWEKPLVRSVENEFVAELHSQGVHTVTWRQETSQL
jgi:hypothetical protein